MLLEYDPRRPEVIANPFPIFAQMREHSPIHYSEILGGWVLTRYDDVRLAISDRRFSADRIRPFFERLPKEKRDRFAPLADSIGRWAVFHDPPEHTRLRNLMNRAFTARAVEKLAPKVQASVHRILDRICGRGEMDLIADFAYPLPASVILEMMGMPCDDLDRIKVWSDELAMFIGSSVNAPDKYARANESIIALNGFFREAIERHRQQPGDDLLTALLAARDQGDVLSDDELVATCVLLVFAGHETTTNLIGNGMLALLQHPKELEDLREHPELLPTAVEELLRYDGPAGAVVRIAREEIHLHDQTIASGERVFAMLHAANRDPRQFDDPENLNLQRAENRHLAFGHGIHFCIGAPLARLEARLAIEAILARCQDLTLLNEELTWSNSLVLRGVCSLPVSFLPSTS